MNKIYDEINRAIKNRQQREFNKALREAAEYRRLLALSQFKKIKNAGQ